MYQVTSSHASTFDISWHVKFLMVSILLVLVKSPGFFIDTDVRSWQNQSPRTVETEEALNIGILHLPKNNLNVFSPQISKNQDTHEPDTFEFRATPKVHSFLQRFKRKDFCAKAHTSAVFKKRRLRRASSTSLLVYSSLFFRTRLVLVFQFNFQKRQRKNVWNSSVI